MIKRIGLVILVLVLSGTDQGFGAGTARGDDVVLAAGSAIRPLDVVTSSVSRALGSRRSPGPGLDTGEERRADIRRASDDLFGVDGMARRALGPHWKALAPRERDEFVGLFRGLLGESFVMIVDRYTGDPVVSVTEELAETFAQVRSRITPQDGPAITIEYRLSRSGSRWTVYDIVLDGVSLMSTYRSGFNAILGTSSVARLLEQMRAGPPWTPPQVLRGPLAALLLLSARSPARGGR